MKASEYWDKRLRYLISKLGEEIGEAAYAKEVEKGPPKHLKLEVDLKLEAEELEKEAFEEPRKKKAASKK